MARQFAWAFAALLLCTVPGSASAECGQQQGAQQKQGGARGDSKPDQGHQPSKWWIDPKLRVELGINDQQSALIESIWQKDLQKRSEAGERVRKLDADLTKMILDGADEVLVGAQIERLVTARGENDKARLLLLYRMNKVLTADQRAKVDAMVKAMRSQRDGGPGRRDSSSK
jgi:Spy/CpxP family protein refolding chaperone